MALAESGYDGALNGTTAVDVVPAPASAHTLIVRSIIICNRDTAAVTLTLNLINGANTRRLTKQTLDADATFVFESIVNLDSTTKKIQAVLAGAPATTNPDFVAAYADRS